MILTVLFGIVWTVFAAQNADTAATASGWTQLFAESFEDDFSADWTIADLDGGTNGEYYWNVTGAEASDGSRSVWVAGGGAQGNLLDPSLANYPDNAASSMIRSAVNLTNTTFVQLRFDYWMKTEEMTDTLEVRVSTDGSNYSTVSTYSGDSSGWQSANLDLSPYAGETAVNIQFLFTSNDSVNDRGIFLDDIVLEASNSANVFMPVFHKDPTFTPPPYFYFDDFQDPGSGWPVVDNTDDPSDCFKWFYSGGSYNVDICDDRTDVKVSPLVTLPNGDYRIDVDARFRHDGGWWSAYGILFDAKDEPDPNKPDLGDYYMLWVLWTSTADEPRALWKILRDVPGAQEDVIDWRELKAGYNYDNRGLDWNSWTIIRTDHTISVYVNDTLLANLSEPRPRTNNQVLFGVYASTYETNIMKAGFDNFKVTALNASMEPAAYIQPQPFFQSGEFDLAPFLPPTGE